MSLGRIPVVERPDRYAEKASTSCEDPTRSDRGGVRALLENSSNPSPVAPQLRKSPVWIEIHNWPYVAAVEEEPTFARANTYLEERTLTTFHEVPYMTGLKEILAYRAKVARMGERDLFHWWESEAGAETGTYVLQRLFPRTAAWVAIEMAVESARARHEFLVPKIPTIHVFNLGPELERQLADTLFRLKLDGGDVTPFQLQLHSDAVNSVSAALRAIGITPETGETAERACCLGEVTLVDLKHPTSLVRKLVSAYGHSQPKHLVVPYFRLVGEL